MKTDIIIGIILTLLYQGKTKAKNLALKYNVSTRTIYRYISILDTCEIPICTHLGRNGGIEILNTFKLNNMFLTTQEKMTLIDATRYIEDKNIQKNIQTKLLSIK